MKVPLEDEGLHTGTYEEQSGVEKALPGGGAGVVDELDQQPGGDPVKRVYNQTELNRQQSVGHLLFKTISRKILLLIM